MPIDHFLIVRVLNEARVNAESLLRKREPLILAVANYREDYAGVVLSTAEEPPLTLGELVETAKVCSTTVSLIIVLKTPL